MSNIELFWYVCVATGCVIALMDWRRAIYVGILIDVLRDPIRKLAPTQPVTITLSGAVVWLVIVILAAFSKRKHLQSLYRNYPGVRTALHLVLIALIPAFGISAISYYRGWLMASIGAASYVLPMFGIVAGFALCEREDSIMKVLRCYILVNVIMLISVPMEYLKLDVPALGGIDNVWIRYRPGVIVDLMCGWYRSPDIMGLHAAHVIMFSLLSCVRHKAQLRGFWIVTAIWAAFCVLLSGRRKMIGIPLVFVAAFLALGTLYRVSRVNRFVAVSVFACLLGGAGLLFFWGSDEASDYTEYATSLFTEGGERANSLIVSGTITTLRQSGLIGAGLGTATQGRYYAGVVTDRSSRGWQEDGVSRLFLEFGVPGVILLLVALCLLIGALAKSMRMLPPSSPQILLQLGLAAVVIGDAASYAISHQQFSGDPVSALLVTLLVGMVLGLPGVYFAQQKLETIKAEKEAQKAAEDVVPDEGLLVIAAGKTVESPGEERVS